MLSFRMASGSVITSMELRLILEVAFFNNPTKQKVEVHHTSQ